MRTTTSRTRSRRRSLAAALASLCACNAGVEEAPHDDAECATCHPTHSSAHATSAHARAGESELFRALVARADASARAFCDRCHAPRGASGARGVACVTCHTAIATRGVSNGRLIAGDGDEMLGGFDARPTSAHASRRSDFTRSPELCGTCHEVAGPGAFVETPYTEWASSPARAVGVTCVDCHMADDPGVSGARRATGPAATDGPPRALSDHRFVGPEHPRAGELLRHAASLSLVEVSRDERSLRVEVTVSNRNGGHALPSGARFAREVWIELAAVDARGATHVVTGGLDARGAPSSNDDQRVDLGDRLRPRGHPSMLLDAAPSEVRAIPAGARRAWTFAVPAAWEGASTTSVTARLRYRRNAWALRASLGLAPDPVAPFDLAAAELRLRR
jgi:hypothetical protein